MNRSILLDEMHEVSFEGGLRSLWASNLNLLPECLESLLFPEYCRRRDQRGRGLTAGNNIQGTLPRTCTKLNEFMSVLKMVSL